jgi:hypothetical protein
MYISEKDAPFEVIEWNTTKSLTSELILELGEHPKSTPVLKSSIQEFFNPLIEERDWHKETEKEQVQKYKRLHKIFKENIANLTVFRVGKINITYYIIGHLKSELEGLRQHHYVGVKTEATET